MQRISLHVGLSPGQFSASWTLQAATELTCYSVANSNQTKTLSSNPNNQHHSHFYQCRMIKYQKVRKRQIYFWRGLFNKLGFEHTHYRMTYCSARMKRTSPCMGRVREL